MLCHAKGDRMMKYVSAFILKLIMTAAILLIINTGIYGGDVSTTLWISLVLAIFAFVLGDILIFNVFSKRYAYVMGNTIATFSDAVLAFVIIYFMGSALYVETVDILAASLLSSIVLGVGEWLFHKYMETKVLEPKPVSCNVSFD